MNVILVICLIAVLTKASGTIRCPPRYEACSAGDCILSNWICDGEVDCNDGSDERNCSNQSSSCFKLEFKCEKEKKCVSIDKVCDGILDCSEKDKSDEGIKCDTTMCKNCGNASGAIDKYCDCCYPGFRLSTDKAICIDIDECRTGHDPCDGHRCVNHKGGFRCECNIGYNPNEKLLPKFCFKTGSQEPFLIYSNYDQILKINSLRGKTENLSSLTSNWSSSTYHSTMLIYNIADNYVLFDQEISGKKKLVLEKLFNEKSFNVQSIRNYFQYNDQDFEDITDLAVDWIHNLIYYVDAELHAVGVFNLRRPENKLILFDNLDKPANILVNPLNSYIVWTHNNSIVTALQDGSKQRTLLEPSMERQITGICMDVKKNIIYWFDDDRKTLNAINYVNGGQIVLMESHILFSSPNSITVLGNYIAWMDMEKSGIFVANIDDKISTRVIKARQGGLVKIVHETLQPTSKNRCLSSQCPYICLPSGLNSYICAAKKLEVTTGSYIEVTRSKPLANTNLTFNAAGAKLGSDDQNWDCNYMCMLNMAFVLLACMLCLLLFIKIRRIRGDLTNNRMTGKEYSVLKLNKM